MKENALISPRITGNFKRLFLLPGNELRHIRRKKSSLQNSVCAEKNTKAMIPIW